METRECFMCHEGVEATSRNAVEILDESIKLPVSGRPLIEGVRGITGSATQDNVKDEILCKKCFKLVQEYDRLTSRVNQIRGQYKKPSEKIESEPTTSTAKSSISDLIMTNTVSKPINKIVDFDKSAIPFMNKISPIPTNLVIVGPKGKKITINNPQAKSAAKLPDKSTRMEVDDIETQMKKIHHMEDPDKNVGDNSDLLIIKRDNSKSETVTYLSEVDGVIVKTESKEHCDEDFVLKELEIVDDNNTPIPMEDEAIFVEETEDGNIIRVVSTNNLLQDEHGNLIYNPSETDGIEMILPDQSSDELQLQYEEISLKDGSSFIKLGPTSLLNKDVFKNQFKKSETILDIEYDGNKNLVDSIDMDEEITGMEEDLETHTAAIKESDNLYSCLICEMMEKDKEKDDGAKEEPDKEVGTFLGDSAQMVEHMFLVHDTQIFICDVCGEVIMMKELLAAHMEEHAKVDKENKCNVCDKSFENQVDLKRHQKTAHSQEKPRPYQCKECGKTFIAQQNLTQHAKTHLGLKEFVCLVCDKAFGTRHNLEVHGVIHTGTKPFKCKTCSKSFARRSEIRDHERTHTGERPYFCEICGATFSQRSNLQSHKRATHFNDKRYKCVQCEKSFKRRRLLEYHVKASHTGERPYRCTVCGATFVYPEHYKKHQRIHSGEKPYKCEVCGKAFNSRDNRNAHRFVHSDKKPYECLDCGAGFMRKPLLYAHMHSQGHLSDTIVVNQPRLNGDNEHTSDDKTSFLVRNEFDESSNKKDGGVNITPILEISTSEKTQDAVEHILPDDEYLGGTESVIDDDVLTSQKIEIIDNDPNHEIIQTEEGTVRLVKVKLPGGESAWVALDSN